MSDWEVGDRVQRLSKLQPHMLNAAQAELYAAMTGGPRGGSNQPFRLVNDTGALTGPFNAMLLEPAVGAALQALGAALRYQGSLPDRSRELAILIVAAHTACEFEQYRARGGGPPGRADRRGPGRDPGRPGAGPGRSGRARPGPRDVDAGPDRRPH